MTWARQSPLSSKQSLPPTAWPLIPRSRPRRSGPRRTTPATAPPVHPHRIAQRSRFTQAPLPREPPPPPGTAQFGTPNLKPARDNSQRQHILQFFAFAFQHRSVPTFPPQPQIRPVHSAEVLQKVKATDFRVPKQALDELLKR